MEGWVGGLGISRILVYRAVVFIVCFLFFMGWVFYDFLVFVLRFSIFLRCSIVFFCGF